jgi:UDP-N-acetylmuramate--alanine ligase
MLENSFKKKIHLIGIGGVGMTPIALLLNEYGFDISGSDISDFRLKDNLISKGINVIIGHSEVNISDNSTVIYSTAVSENNIELITAKKCNNQTLSRIEALKEITSNDRIISITGSYGKSTTTAFVSSILEYVKYDPSWIIGADLLRYPPSKNGKSDLFVLESDESRPDFLDFNPHMIILTNIGKDHLSNYCNSQEMLFSVLLSFLERIDSTGAVFINLDDNLSEKFTDLVNVKNLITCGSSLNADYRFNITSSKFNGKNFVTEFSITKKNENPFFTFINMPGKENVLDAVFAYAVAVELGCSKKISQKAIKNLPILDRRFEVKKVNEKSIIIDDEGDSPDVIKNSLKKIKFYFENKKALVVIQPHRYSRLKNLFKEYIDVLSEYSDDLIITPVYSAGEEKIDGINSESLYNAILKKDFKGKIYNTLNFEEAIDKCKLYIEKDYVIITLGPGDVWRIADELIV